MTLVAPVVQVVAPTQDDRWKSAEVADQKLVADEDFSIGEGTVLLFQVVWISSIDEFRDDLKERKRGVPACLSQVTPSKLLTYHHGIRMPYSIPT
jgi:hypothetical protein